MAGHSKWANIKHKKERADARKGKVFSRVVKEIISAAKQGGPDPKSNSKLRLAIEKAKAVNLPSENIERNIKKASSADQQDYFEMTYELYGHGGVGIIVDVMTDNKNRIASDIRIATNKRGGTIATPGAVSFNFERKGVIHVAKKEASEDALFLAASDAGAEDFEVVEEIYVITTPPELLYKVKDAIDVPCEEASLEMVPKSFVEVDEEMRAANLALVEWLDSIDDVDAIYHNMQ
ncbi:MAG: YebC/PmpR family DNA-binding transcriptional regulator [Candidatus Algichlamydia australiensis]|nr:YebC/PmpR family DNA-binding transcriptional regulator [Chlamydiales bacterium]